MEGWKLMVENNWKNNKKEWKIKLVKWNEKMNE